MPAISIRGTEMPASPIRKLAPLADAAKQRGVHVISNKVLLLHLRLHIYMKVYHQSLTFICQIVKT